MRALKVALALSHGDSWGQFIALSSYQQIPTDWTRCQTGGIVLPLMLPCERTRNMLKLRDFVRTPLYDNEEEAIQGALRHLESLSHNIEIGFFSLITRQLGKSPLLIEYVCQARSAA